MLAAEHQLSYVPPHMNCMYIETCIKQPPMGQTNFFPAACMQSEYQACKTSNKHAKHWDHNYFGSVDHMHNLGLFTWVVYWVVSWQVEFVVGDLLSQDCWQQSFQGDQITLLRSYITCIIVVTLMSM